MWDRHNKTKVQTVEGVVELDKEVVDQACTMRFYHLLLERHIASLLCALAQSMHLTPSDFASASILHMVPVSRDKHLL